MPALRLVWHCQLPPKPASQTVAKALSAQRHPACLPSGTHSWHWVPRCLAAPEFGECTGEFRALPRLDPWALPKSCATAWHEVSGSSLSRVGRLSAGVRPNPAPELLQIVGPRLKGCVVPGRPSPASANCKHLQQQARRARGPDCKSLNYGHQKQANACAKRTCCFCCLFCFCSWLVFCIWAPLAPFAPVQASFVVF